MRGTAPVLISAQAMIIEKKANKIFNHIIEAINQYMARKRGYAVKNKKIIGNYYICHKKSKKPKK